MLYGISQAARRSLEAARSIAQVVITSLSTMESDAANFREHVNASGKKNDQGLLELAEAYEVGIPIFSQVSGSVLLRISN